MRFDKTRSAGFLTNHLARLFAHHLQARIGPLGLAPAQFMTLLELWETDGLTQAELVTRLDVEQATMANTLNRMARDGLIDRVPHPEDKRARLVRLTDKAKALEGPAKAAAQGINADALAGLSEADRERFLATLNEIIGTLRRR
ncbi:MAG: MarR family transcriptional regulator [Alphaproteobacteria bacterium]|nr:MarR family transcriptional regulator [Alphaproteobacteria bacterium]